MCFTQMAQDNNAKLIQGAKKNSSVWFNERKKAHAYTIGTDATFSIQRFVSRNNSFQ